MPLGRLRRTVLNRDDAGTFLCDALTAGSVAAVLSGVPSTMHAIVTRTSPLEATLAAGTLLLPDEQRPLALLLSAGIAHGALSLGWAVVLATLLPRGRELPAAVPAGLAIAALDLGLVGRRVARIRALPLTPQLADHVAYALAVAAVLRRRRATA